MTSTRYLLTAAIFLHLYSSISSSQETCSTGYDFDVFRLFTKVPYQAHLKELLAIEGPRLEGNDPSEPCFQFSGTMGLKVPDRNIINRISNATCVANEATMYGSVFFKGKEIGGTVLELYHVNETFLGLSVCRVNSEVTVTYRHNNKLHFESFPFKFFTGKWYKVAAVMSGNLIRVFVNCTEIGEKIVPLPDYCPDQSGLDLITGSGCLTKELSPCNNSFTGSLQSVGLQSGTDGVGKYCPKLRNKTQCPVCGSFLTLFKKHLKLREEARTLRTAFKNCSQTIAAMNCSVSPRSCLIQNLTIGDNSFVTRTDGHICYCRDGTAHCTNPNTTAKIQVPTETTRAPPSNPTPAPAQLKSCSEVTFFGITFTLQERQEKYITVPPLNNPQQCLKVTCGYIGNVLFNMEDYEQCSSVSRVCSGASIQSAVCCNYCSACTIAECPANSTCYNSTTTDSGYRCVCNSGLRLSSDQKSCDDINECSLSPSDTNAHNCPSNAKCINAFGSFRCQCPSGFQLQQINNSPQCVDIDECKAGTAMCDSEATCMNTDGDYRCVCNEGYALVGKHQCMAVCEKPCQNGGECTSPGNCTCVPGFTGDQCQTDIDECKNDSLNECSHQKSLCMNTKGGYFCSCAEGYQWNSTMKQCIDINECTTGIHKCLNSRWCKNLFGSYKCLCDGDDCTGHCLSLKDRQLIHNGGKVTLGTDNCDECVCKEGRIQCARRPCDCDAPDVSLVCCPDCHRNTCHVGELIVEKNNTYIDPSNRCLRKECAMGSNGNYVLRDMNVECPSIGNCPRNKTYTPEGACCPVCQLPVCKANTQPVITNCERCTCDGTNWTCTGISACPQLNCPQEQLIYLPGQCCPVCHGSVVDNLSCS